jgi:hypothetical protein
MATQEYRSRYGRIVVEGSGIKVMESGTEPLFVPWHAVGHMQSAELERGRARRVRVRLIRMHLADGRTVELPAPAGEGFDLAAAEIFRAWRDYTRTRVREPQDEIPPEYRAAAARELDPIQDAPPGSIQDAPPPRFSGSSPSRRRWMRWRIGG